MIKKIIIAVFAALFVFTVSFGESAIEVYDFKGNLKLPTLEAGVRTYKSTTFVGSLIIEYDDILNLSTNAYIIATNKKTRVVHEINMTDQLYALLGKTTKTMSRSVPTIWLSGADTTNTYAIAGENHETIVFMNLAGTGTMKIEKTTTISCSFCSGEETNSANCSKIKKLTGNLNGIVVCNCPPDELWNHTMLATYCGPYYDSNGNAVRVSTAAFYGTWTAKYNKKASKMFEK